MKLNIFNLFCLILFLSGCQTVPKNVEKNETNKDVQTALETIAGAVSQKDLTEEEIKNFEKQLRKDEEAQSAVRVISDSMTGKNIRIKYCPIGGKRYDPKIEECPIHKVKLEYIE